MSTVPLQLTAMRKMHDLLGVKSATDMRGIRTIGAQVITVFGHPARGHGLERSRIYRGLDHTVEHRTLAVAKLLTSLVLLFLAAAFYFN